jgi:hypothetical protein
VTYKNKDGDLLTSDPVIIGVPVAGKIDFAVVSPPAVFNPGTKKTLSVTYRNTGSATAYSAEARIIAVDHFTTTDDTSYLGDMAPGSLQTAHFEITVDGSAAIKEYAPDSEIKYRDALDNDQVSDRVKVPIQVTPLSGLALLLTPYGILLMVIIGIVIVWFFVIRKKKQSA